MNEAFVADWAVIPDYMESWYRPMDFGNDMPDDEPDGEDNYNFD